jgi:C4-dicarboxylate-specific signal transduction histidine kinase
MLSAPLLLAVASALILLLAAWWFRERRLERQRRSVQASYALSEEIIAASSPTAIAEKLEIELPLVVPATTCQVYLFNRGTRCLERVATEENPDPMVALVDDPPDGMAHAAVVCFRNRTPLNVPDVRRNPLVKAASGNVLPRSAMFVPLIAQQEALGVLEVDDGNRVGYFSLEDQAAIQHLANQVAASLKLQEQQAMREQLFRGEKLAATGQLISGVASELRAPLESILQLAASMGDYVGQPVPEIDVKQLAAEANRASEIVARLVSFAEQEDAAPRAVDVSSALGSLTHFREPEWRAMGLRVQNHLGAGPALVLGVAGQLEQVFLTLLVHAEQRAVRSPTRTVTLKTSNLGGRVLVEIDYSVSPAADAEPDPFTDTALSEGGALGFGVCQGIIRNHGGEIRLRRRSAAFGFEVDLPSLDEAGQPPTVASPHHKVGPLTLMLVEPDANASRQLVTLLGARGHRVIPAPAEAAGDLVQRLRFDAVLWAVRSGRSGWSEFYERIRTTVTAFVLISDGFNQDLANSLEQSGGFLLARPVQEAALDRILSEIGTRTNATT